MFSKLLTMHFVCLLQWLELSSLPADGLVLPIALLFKLTLLQQSLRAMNGHN